MDLEILAAKQAGPPRKLYLKLSLPELGLRLLDLRLVPDIAGPRLLVPRRMIVDYRGQPQINVRGERRTTPTISFDDAAAYEAFRTAVVGACEATCPHKLEWLQSAPNRNLTHGEATHASGEKEVAEGACRGHVEHLPGPRAGRSDAPAEGQPGRPVGECIETSA